MKQCSYCAEEIQDDAVLCRFCHSSLVPQPNGLNTPVAGSPVSAGTRPAATPRVIHIILWILALLTVTTVGGIWFLSSLSSRTDVDQPVKRSAEGERLHKLIESVPDTTPVEAAPGIRASELWDEFERNAVAADAKYQSGVTVNGLVKDIGADIADRAYLILGDNLDTSYGVQAFFAGRSRRSLESLSKGTRVTVTCERSSGKVFNVILLNCSLR